MSSFLGRMLSPAVRRRANTVSGRSGGTAKSGAAHPPTPPARSSSVACRKLSVDAGAEPNTEAASTDVPSPPVSRQPVEAGSAMPTANGDGASQAVPRFPEAPQASPPSRPSSRSAAKRRPAPKVLTEGALKVNSGLPMPPADQPFPPSPSTSRQAPTTTSGSGGAGSAGFTSGSGGFVGPAGGGGVAASGTGPARPVRPISGIAAAAGTRRSDSGPSAASKEPNLSARRSQTAGASSNNNVIFHGKDLPNPAEGPEAAMLRLAQASNNPHCSISTDTDPAAEIRTKVFRIGAPLLRSTIPVALGRQQGSHHAEVSTPAHRTGAEDGSDLSCNEDVETVLSLSDVEMEDQGHLSVTLDFPC
eukprot:TRINITY_DN25543_c0_g1_i2.p1 TRINITY_DN25543_c0_g1~~TRINITY_DN25543_c0_g1_i2.p1  ORF type:complete len:361 (-),score=71.75 TRINITY_DN25543_c0_g1_i2:213-1295(-)